MSYIGNVVTVIPSALSGNLDVGVGAAQTRVKAHVNHIGYNGFVEMEARWSTQGYLNFDTARLHNS